MQLEWSVIIALFAIVMLVMIAWKKFWSICEQANNCDWNSVWLNRLDGLNNLYCKYYHGLEYEKIPLPETGAAIIVANHVSGLDPVLIVAACHRPVRFLIDKKQYERFGTMWLFKAIGCIPVERSGKPEKAMRAAIKAVKKGEIIALFPYGGIHLPDAPAKKIKGGAIRLAMLSQADIIPLHVDGINRKSYGHVVKAIFIRSHARLHHLPRLQCCKSAKKGEEAITYKTCLEQLQTLIDYNLEVKK